ncbi:sensor histidine kinase KdpD [Paenibacillus sp. JCM 10914]|uniref:sensor histidine kinase n=1 Tax=Paenibacillus sp. JCM 10914 TaxID=1236974 RepID=UPI0003CC51B6|nr:HAMP domain-containing sensor histidine kinase [Paenibacillus sp. JCM 10914]GAE06508.1 osmosensitive K+ channel histidine kinase KdpD [Paenibacillus sp. JCM 10914]
MILLLCVIIGVLAVIIGWQWYSRRKRNQIILEITSGISNILEYETTEKVLVPTGDDPIQQLLIQINRLLDNKQKVFADYARTKDSQRKMISNMSHDLKTPLTVILGYTEKLNQKNSLTAQEEEQVILRLNEKVNGLISLLNQFFDLVKIESEDYDIALSKISLSEVCRNTVLEFYDLLISKNLRVEIDIPEQPYYFHGNKDALHRILSNLISNSIRYGSMVACSG